MVGLSPKFRPLINTILIQIKANLFCLITYYSDSDKKTVKSLRMSNWKKRFHRYWETIKPTKKWETTYLMVIFPIPGSSILYALYVIYKYVERATHRG